MSASAALPLAPPDAAVHAPQVAGRFYPADPGVLAARIDAALAGANPGASRAKMVVMPHAGLDYCAPVSALSARALDASAPIRRIVILGPNHRWRLGDAAGDGSGRRSRARRPRLAAGRFHRRAPVRR